MALGDSCPIAVRWNDVLYMGYGARHASPERGARLTEGESLDCTREGRCAPPEVRTAVFALDVVASEIAIAAPAVDAETPFLLAPGTFPALPDHPLHEAIFGSPSSPNYRQGCGGAFRLVGEVTQATFNLRIRAPEEPPEELETVENQIWIGLDAQTRVEGFDRNGVATIVEGDEIAISARVCEGHGELPGPLADLIQPG